LKLILFCVAVAVGGFLVIPRVISLAGKSRSDEVLLITVLGLVFGLALWSAKLGYSIALGSFLVGAVVAEVKEVHRIERLVAPLRDLFSAIFFTSSGMLIRFDLSLEGVGQVALISLVLIFGKIGWVTFGALLGGCDLRSALRTGMSLAQIGEFSFIIAGLGMALGSTGSRLYSLAVLVSAVTTLTTPYLISWSAPMADWLERQGPRWFVDFWGWYHSGWKGFQSAPNSRRATARSMVRKLLGQLGLQLALMTAPIVGAVGLWQAYRNQLPEIFRLAWWGAPLFWLGGALLALPVVVAFIRKYHAFGILVSEMAFRRGEGNERVGPTRALATFLVCGIGYILLGFYLILISSPLLPSTHLVLGLVGAVAFLGVGIRRRLVKIYSQGQESIRKTWQVVPDQPPIQLPGNSQVRSYRVEKGSPLVGQTLHEIELRKRSGVVVVAIERADGNVVSPGPNEKVGIGDELFIFGGADQLNLAEEFFKTQQVTSV
jgi:CPA2 family monovalent cation:H+ antiporter-2